MKNGIWLSFCRLVNFIVDYDPRFKKAPNGPFLPLVGEYIFTNKQIEPIYSEYTRNGYSRLNEEGSSKIEN